MEGTEYTEGISSHRQGAKDAKVFLGVLCALAVRHSRENGGKMQGARRFFLAFFAPSRFVISVLSALYQRHQRSILWKW